MNASFENISPAGAQLIGNALGTSVSASLTDLNVSSNNIRGDGAEQLAAAVLRKQSLECFCKIPLKELRANSLTELNLRGKGVGMPGALVLAELLRTGSASLTDLNLRDNEIGPEGAKSLADALKVNASLTSLNLSSNELCKLGRGFFQRYTSQGIITLANALRDNTSLTSCDLVGNDIAAKDAKTICEWLSDRVILDKAC
jgi:Ran GTPase-activating protein (RanGAP) involved in mRNA processing and transport